MIEKGSHWDCLTSNQLDESVHGAVPTVVVAL